MLCILGTVVELGIIRLLLKPIIKGCDRLFKNNPELWAQSMKERESLWAWSLLTYSYLWFYLWFYLDYFMNLISVHNIFIKWGQGNLQCATLCPPACPGIRLNMCTLCSDRQMHTEQYYSVLRMMKKTSQCAHCNLSELPFPVLTRSLKGTATLTSHIFIFAGRFSYTELTALYNSLHSNLRIK